jgi:hypothetical protein
MSLLASLLAAQLLHPALPASTTLSAPVLGSSLHAAVRLPPPRLQEETAEYGRIDVADLPLFLPAIPADNPVPTPRTPADTSSTRVPVPQAVSWGPPLVHTALLLTTMRVTEALLWPNPFADFRPEALAERYRRAWSTPPLFDPNARPFEWDHDHWTINVIGHGLLGSELYNRPRHCGFSPWGALAFAAVASATWEYVFEASGVQPSALDLVYTPLMGLALGEARYQVWRLAGGIRSPVARTVVQVLVDPFGEVERRLGLAGC